MITHTQSYQNGRKNKFATDPNGRNQFKRELAAPSNLGIPFWPLKTDLKPLESYESTMSWFTGMKPATKRIYATHLRLFCKFYSSNPDILVMFTADQLRILLDAYLKHLLDISEKEAGKPKPDRFSVNSVGHYFTGLRSFFVEHEIDINWIRYQKKFPEKVSSKLRGYNHQEIEKLYQLADIFDKPLVALEFQTMVRVGAIPQLRFEHLKPLEELKGYYYITVYAESKTGSYSVIVSPRLKADIDALAEYRQRWGEQINPKSFIICHRNRKAWRSPLSIDSIRHRMQKLAQKAGVDLSNIQPNHGMRKAGNTAMKNAHVDKDFKEMLMGHSTGLDDTYYDLENPDSRREIVKEYVKAIPNLTIDKSEKLERQLISEQTRNDVIEGKYQRAFENLTSLIETRLEVTGKERGIIFDLEAVKNTYTKGNIHPDGFVMHSAEDLIAGNDLYLTIEPAEEPMTLNIKATGPSREL